MNAMTALSYAEVMRRMYAPLLAEGGRNLAKRYPGVLLKKPWFQKGKMLNLDGCDSTPTMADGARNTHSIAVHAPTDERGISTPDSSLGVSHTSGADCGRGAPTCKGGGMAMDMLRTPRPPEALRKAASGSSNVPIGAEAMKATTITPIDLYALRDILHLCAFAADARGHLQAQASAEQAGYFSPQTLLELKAADSQPGQWETHPDTLGAVLSHVARQIEQLTDSLSNEG